jgi:hypothetical protein
LYTTGPKPTVYLDNTMDTLKTGSGSQGWVWGIPMVDIPTQWTTPPSGWKVSH